MAGFLFGSLGLASAGALPDSVQDVAHDVLDHVGVDVPPGHDRFNDPTECPGGPYKNHGDFVKQNKDNASSAAQSDCGKPLVSTQHSDESSNGTEGSGQESDDHGQSGSHSNSSGGNDDKSDNSTHSSSADDQTTNSSTGSDKKPESGPPGTPNSNSSRSSSGS